MDLGRLVNGERKINNPKPENAGSLLIFCEGSTEYNYLSYFKSYLEHNLKAHYSSIVLEPINAEGNAMHVYNYAEEFLKNDTNRKKYDLYEKHLVFDCDAPENIEEVLRLMSLSENEYVIDYSTDRLDNDVVCECIEEVWDAFFIGVHNAELTQQTANLMDKYNQIADKIAENGYIATWCTENYARLMLLWLRRNDYRSAANCWKQMMKFQQRFADDEDILKAIAGAADALYDIYRENQVPGRRCKLLKDMERIFDETHNADVANALAILEANEHTIYDPPAVFDSNKSEILLSTENKLKEIYEVFPNEGKVVLGYSYLVSWNYVTWPDFPRPIDEELIPLFKKWIRKFPENKLELMEYYSFILFEKWLYMDSLDNISEANKIYYEIKAIADELSKDYADNQVTQMLSMGIVRKL